jgi:hypothetical protein
MVRVASFFAGIFLVAASCGGEAFTEGPDTDAGLGARSAGAAPTEPSKGGASAGSHGAMAGASGETVSPGVGGDSAGTGGDFAGSGGDSSGTGGDSAGSGGDGRDGSDSAGAGGAPAVDRSLRFVAVRALNAQAESFSVAVPPEVAAGDQLLLFFTFSALDRTAGEPAGIEGLSLLGEEVTTGTVSRVWLKVAAAGDVGKAVTIKMSGLTKAALTMAAYRGVGIAVQGWHSAAETQSTTQHTTPVVDGVADSWLISYWGEKSGGTTLWTPPEGHALRSSTFGAGGGRISSLLLDSNGPVADALVGKLSATSDYASAQSTMWSILLGP